MNNNIIQFTHFILHNLAGLLRLGFIYIYIIIIRVTTKSGIREFEGKNNKNSRQS